MQWRVFCISVDTILGSLYLGKTKYRKTGKTCDTQRFPTLKDYKYMFEHICLCEYIDTYYIESGHKWTFCDRYESFSSKQYHFMRQFCFLNCKCTFLEMLSFCSTFPYSLPPLCTESIRILRKLLRVKEINSVEGLRIRPNKVTGALNHPHIIHRSC